MASNYTFFFCALFFNCTVIFAQIDYPNSDLLGTLVYNDISFDYKKTPAKEILEQLERDLDILVAVQWKTDKQEGIEPLESITIKSTNKPALIVINQLVSKLADKNIATWQLRHGVLEIGLKKLFAARARRVETYSIQELLFKVKHFKAPELDSTDITDPEEPETTEQKSKALINIITQMIEPKLWEQQGGPCSIRNYKDTLLINAPDFIHRKIGGYRYLGTQPQDIKLRRVRYLDDSLQVIVDHLPPR